MKKDKINLPFLRKKMYITIMKKLSFSLALLLAVNALAEKVVSYKGRQLKCSDFELTEKWQVALEGKILDINETMPLHEAGCQPEDMNIKGDKKRLSNWKRPESENPQNRKRK